METKSKRIFPSTQLIVALDARVLKVYLWILSWSSSQGSVKFYEKQFAKACKMTEDEVELCIQSLVDAKLIDISRVDQTWMLTPNEEQNQKYYQIPISKVLEGKGINMAEHVSWNCDVEPKQDVVDMSEEQIRTMILRLQAQLNEKKEVRKMVTSSVNVDDLPF
jgi:hypothetical protein